jgi:integrase
VPNESPTQVVQYINFPTQVGLHCFPSNASNRGPSSWQSAFSTWSPRRRSSGSSTTTSTTVALAENAAFSERDKLIIRIFGDCGLRIAELTQLKPTDIMRSGRHAYLRVLGKGSRMRDVPLPPQILRRPERHIAGRPIERSSDRIFLSHRRGPSGDYDPLTANGIYQAIKDAADRAGITKHIHPHLFRHSWMTEMLRNGMRPVQLFVIAGASVQVISEHYAHLTKDDAYEAMMRVLASKRD